MEHLLIVHTYRTRIPDGIQVLGWIRGKAPANPKVPTFFPSMLAQCDWAQSSITGIEKLSAIRLIALTLEAIPYR
jgi:hypothetical protein